MKQESKRILMLSSAEEADTRAINDAFVAQLNPMLSQDDIIVDWHNYHDIFIELAPGEMQATIISTGRRVQDYDAVYFKSYFRYHEQATCIAEILQFHNIPFIGSELRSYIAAYKLSQMARLARKDMTIPRTIYLPTEAYVEHFDSLVDKLGNTFIFKAVSGSTGDDNYLIKDKAQLQEIVAKSSSVQFIAQSFVPNDSDLRMLILGGHLRMIIERRRADNSTHLNNTSQGAAAKLVDIDSFDPLAIEVALRAAEVMGRDIAGVDIMLETGTNKPYVLEVNASPQIASGAFEAEKRALYTQYFKEVVGRV